MITNNSQKLLTILSLFIIPIALMEGWSEDKNNMLKEGNYYGGKGLHAAFMKIQNGVAIIDFFHVEKAPMSFYTDTIVINNTNENIFNGKLSSVIYEKGKAYINGKCPSNHNETIKIKIELNDEKYKKVETYKNSTLLFKDDSDFAVSNKSHSNSIERLKVRDSLKAKFEIIDKVKNLTNQQFIIEFEKFKKASHETLSLIETKRN